MPKEIDIIGLLNILRSPSSSDEDLVSAMELLRDNERSLIEYLQKQFHHDLTLNGGENSNEKEQAYAQIQSEILLRSSVREKSLKTKYGIFRISFIRAAAVLFILIGISSLLVFMHSQSVKKDLWQANVSNILIPIYDTLSNNGSHNASYVLPDSSRVRLSPKSYVYFQKRFSKDKKIVYLNGEGVFTVKKDERRPFSVYSNGFEVRDLGTIFSVNTDGHNLKVKLIKGLVLIHALDSAIQVKDIRLVPNQIFAWDNIVKDYTLKMERSVFQANTGYKLKSAGHRSNNINSLAFSASIDCKNVALENVFAKIKLQFEGVRILYDKKGIQAKSFTGTIDADANLLHTLDLICKTNGLEYTIEGNNIYIK